MSSLLSILVAGVQYPEAALQTLVAGCWAASMCILIGFYDPGSRGRRSIGRANKTALETACLLAAATMRYSVPCYDPYIRDNNDFSEYSVNMYYYIVLVLATHMVYGYLKAVRLPADVDFGDLWSVTLMENLVYWAPASSTAAQLASFALCSAAVAYSHSYHPSSRSIVPEGLASCLVSALGLPLFFVPFLCDYLLHLIIGDGDWVLRMRIVNIFSFFAGYIYLYTLGMRWTREKVRVDNERAAAETKKKQVDAMVLVHYNALQLTRRGKKNWSF
ncbi:unnamed protein product [Linum trigynum]|uniref:Uncharacterized protein n=1 Tax=Linum trigynum TaxID=586398 RepID=A0AAV2GHZ0_9ROSI